MKVSATRLIDGPIVSPSSDASIGDNIQGPSLIKVPSWVANPLGRYYLYFADHKGKYIRLAYADALAGPWQIHEPGALKLEDSLFLVEPPAPPAQSGQQTARFTDGASIPAERSHDAHLEASFTHVASPDVHVREEASVIVMYYHGLESYGKQSTRLAVSGDGINFEAHEKILGRTYFRVFEYRGQYFALAMPGLLYRSHDGYSGFEQGPSLFNKDMRHTAVLRIEDTLYVFWTQVGHVPERILLSTMDLRADWHQWQASEPVEVLRPEHPYEGADAPLEPSIRSTAYGHVNQLRDPAVYVEDDTIYLLYAVAGESGIAIAKVSIK
jgi:hypothetical protein